MKRNNVLASLLLAAVCVPSLALAHSRTDYFSPVGLVAGQTARLTVVNLASYANRKYPCRVSLRYVDGDGATVTNAAGNRVQADVNLAPGIAAFLDFTPTTSSTAYGGRRTVRPVVQSNSAHCTVQASAEIFSSATGIATVAIPQIIFYPPQPIIPPQPILPSSPVGFIGLVGSQTARLTVVNVGTTQASQCRFRLSFFGTDGQPVANADGNPVVSEVTLAGGGVSTFLDVPFIATRNPDGPVNRLTIRPAVQRISSSGNCQVLANAEIFDSTTGATTVLYPPQPVRP